MQPAFAIWITGLPASGKSSLAAAIVRALKERGVEVAVIESDVLRRVLTPHATYLAEERDRFYREMASLGTLLVENGTPVLFDATANLRAHRERAREMIPRFLEVYVDTPLWVCEARDPKGIYRDARRGTARNVPGVQVTYEPSSHPDLIVHGQSEPPDEAASRVLALLLVRGFLTAPFAPSAVRPPGREPQYGRSAR